jgi:hypothetical protein
MTLPSQYQKNLIGSDSIPTSTPGSGYGSYVFEISSPLIGQNFGSPGLFLWEHNSLDSSYQSILFPSGITGGPSDGYDTGPASGGTYYEVVPVALGRPNEDPETYAGMIAGTASPRQYQLALYAADPNAAAMPTISPNGGTFGGSTTVTLSCSTPSSTIYYTTNGITPTATPSEQYSSPFTLGSSAIVQAMATAGGFNNSAVASAPFTIIPSSLTSITITSVTHSGSSTVLNWAPAPTGSYSYTVWRTSSLNPVSWTSLLSGISASTYTDTTASAGINFYRVSSP